MREALAQGGDPSVIADEAEYQDYFNARADPVILRNWGIFAEAGFDSENSGYVAFTNKLSDKDRKEILSIDGVRLIENAKMSSDSADLVAQDLADQLDQVSEEDSASMVHIDPKSGIAEVVVSEPLSVSESEEIGLASIDRISGAEARGVFRSTVEVKSDVTVKVYVDKSLDFLSDETVNGGDKLTTVGTTSLMCTAGFPAKLSGSAGLMTAGHCPNSLTVDRGNRLYSASKEMSKSEGDAQFHKSRESVSGKFRYAWGSYREVWGHPVLKVGTKVCRFGAKTGNGTGCTKVKYVSACIDYSSGKRCKLAMTEGHTGSQGGDSGGPWYYGNNAYGMHSGSGSRDGVARNWFQPSRRALDSMGLTPVYGKR